MDFHHKKLMTIIEASKKNIEYIREACLESKESTSGET
jgi:hypothetical protein